MWEVFTCGKVPYGRLKNSEVVEMVQRGQVLEKPKGCLNEIYNVSKLFYLSTPKSCCFISHHTNLLSDLLGSGRFP